MQEFFVYHTTEKFSMSENLLVASDLLSGCHVTRYGRYFENINRARHQYRF